MTTIVYHDDVIAYDSRESEKSGTITDDNCNKKTTVKGVHFFCAGYISDKDQLIGAYFGESYERDSNICAFVVDKGKVYLAAIYKDTGYFKQEITASSSIGSGSDHAYTALDMGCLAVGAVKMAIKRDCFTGGRVRIHKVKNTGGNK